MKINSGTVQMDTQHNYSKGVNVTQATKMQQIGTGATTYSETSFSYQYMQYSTLHIASNASKQYDSYIPTEDNSSQGTLLASNLYSNMLNKSRSLEEVKTALEQFHEELIKRIEEFMEQIRKQLLGITTSDAEGLMDLTSSTSQPGSLWTRTDYEKMEITESETTCFQTTGTVQTADGRSIGFHMTMEMSREFTSSIESITSGTQYILTDPLVFHFDDAPDTISDQTWLFDINGDGIKEEISELTDGNGFLALDRNDNGSIDDGNELFGAKTGNGFAELAAFDEDRNGWIDENDAVYSKLKIWTRDSNGNSHLMSLGQADIGAIYLGAADTPFTCANKENNDVQAVIRQTGFYLHESTGSASAIQQIDFASKQNIS